MLAVKLHTDKNLTLSEGTYLIPILRWDTGQVFIRRWWKRLNRSANPKTTQVRYITLVAIPDDHPVAIYITGADKNLNPTEPVFRPLSKIPQHERQQIAEWYEMYASMPRDEQLLNQPEMVLGKPLPRSCIKWTKRIQVLFETDKKGAERGARE